MLAIGACGAEERSAEVGVSADPETSFASFAQDFFRELEQTPLGDSLQAEIGMFGDLNVMAGEHVVMRRYRYRVDDEGGGTSAHLTFSVRAEADDVPVPIVLVFDEQDGSWYLREATYVPGDVDGLRGSPVEDVLSRRLDDWSRRASQRVEAASP